MRQCSRRRRRRLSEDGVGWRGRGETNESERGAGERATGRARGEPSFAEMNS